MGRLHWIFTHAARCSKVKQKEEGQEQNGGLYIGRKDVLQLLDSFICHLIQLILFNLLTRCVGLYLLYEPDGIPQLLTQRHLYSVP